MMFSNDQLITLLPMVMSLYQIKKSDTIGDRSGVTQADLDELMEEAWSEVFASINIGRKVDQEQYVKPTPPVAISKKSQGFESMFEHTAKSKSNKHKKGY